MRQIERERDQQRAPGKRYENNEAHLEKKRGVYIRKEAKKRGEYSMFFFPKSLFMAKESNKRLTSSHFAIVNTLEGLKSKGAFHLSGPSELKELVLAGQMESERPFPARTRVRVALPLLFSMQKDWKLICTIVCNIRHLNLLRISRVIGAGA